MLHGFYQIKAMIRQKSNLFWSLMFPLFLGTAFYFVFGGISEKEMFTEIPVGVVVDNNTQFVEIIEKIEIESGKKMFDVNTFSQMDEALEALEKEEIKGIIDAENQYELTVLKSATDTTMIKAILDQYRQNEALYMRVAEEHPEKLPMLLEMLSQPVDRHIAISEIDLKGQDKDCYSQYFFALLAMTCLIACNMGSQLGCNLQANCSTLGARRCVAPTPKSNQVVSDFFAIFLLYDALSMVVLIFCVFVLKRDFGTNFLLIVLATFAGNFNGLAAGMFISTMGSGSAKKKTGLCVSYFMVSSFLAGLQWGDITFIIEKNCPIINRINPATLIVNSYKSLAVFGDYKKYATNMGTLLLIGVLFIAGSVFRLRRTKYASL